MSNPFSQACANNQSIILDALKHIFEHKKYALEVGSSTGFFCSKHAKLKLEIK